MLDKIMFFLDELPRFHDDFTAEAGVGPELMKAISIK